jgi:hypothetical protein
MIENRPAAHATHESAPVAPSTVEYRPVPQPVQSQWLSNAPVPNVPARHGRHWKIFWEVSGRTETQMARSSPSLPGQE